MIIQVQDGKPDIGLVELGNNMSYLLEKKLKENLKRYLIESEISPSDVAIKNICDSEKFCSAQGKITFGQLKALVESGSKKRIYKHVGEGGYKATLRLLPWFIPQLSIAGFTGSIIRAVNKILKPTLEETTNYKTWWGKVVMKAFDLAEGELGLTDPLTKIFFISDGLLTLMDDKYKVKFARYIAELASEMPNDQEVPEYFVENELRNWINQKFLLNPPLPPKTEENNNEDSSITEVFKKRVILEKVKNASNIRNIVKDIITVFKKEDDGEFHLPNELKEDEPYYQLPNSIIFLELIIKPSDKVEDFLTNANFYREDDVIVIKIVYNPNNKNKILYDLIGELNELVAHELRHQYQRDKGLYNMDREEDDTEDEDEKEGIEYYSQPEEIDAQVEGFKRMRDITKRPFEELVRNWFRTHKDIHHMNPEEEKVVIDMIINHYRMS